MGRIIRLELENFKSYKGHQTIGPFHKFSCVIGPNGAGKSNLMDAISFVLGVNSLQLRSQNLKDFIYRGGAMQEDGEDHSQVSRETRRKAYVMIVYQDDNGRELRFVRTVNPKGQSEYKINDKVVPWKTYNSTLENENILIRARNFLVFQGDVEHVASQSPKDLTLLIEHISGSLEYKEDYDKLKIEQDRAIENSAFNFNKKRGINSEIKQYQEQKAEAERYEKLGDDKKAKIVRYLLWKLFHVEKKIDDCETEAEEKRIEINTAYSDQSSVDDDFKITRKELAVIHRERIKKELSIKNLERDLQHYRLNGISIDEKISHLRKKVQQTTENNSRVSKDFDHQNSVISDLEDDLSRLNAVIAECTKELQASISQTGAVLDGSQIEEYNTRKQQVSNQAVYEKHQLSNLQRQYKANQEILSRMEEKVTDIRDRQSHLVTEEKTLIDYSHDVEVQISDTTKDLTVKRAELEKLRKEQAGIFEKEHELNGKLQDTLNRLMQAKIDQNESEKEVRFKECLQNLKQIYSGFHGRLADLCKPTQRKYDLAVSIVLGRNIDAVVVDNEKTAMDCIQYMRDQRAGHATFIPLDTIVAPAVDERFRTIANGAKLAVDVLEYDDQYERALLYACGNSLVCDTLAIAKHICYERNQEVKAVTLDGTVIHRTGLITGGETVGTAKQWEERELEGLKQTRDNLLAQLNELSKKKRRGSAEENAKSECEALETKLNFLREELKGTQTKLAGIRSELEHLGKQLAAEEVPYIQASSNLRSQAETISDLETHISRIEDEVFSDFCSRINVANIREYESSQLKGTQELNEKMLNLKTQRSKVENQLIFERQQFDELQERLTKLKNVLTNDNSEIESMDAEKEEYIRKLNKIEDSIEKIESQVATLKEKEDAQEKLVEERRKSLGQKGQEVDKMMKTVTDIETTIEKLRADRMSIFRRCKLEEIDIPLNQGSMEDVPMDDSEDAGEAMELDEPSQMSIQSTNWAISVNYSSLSRNFKENDDSSIEDEFQAGIQEISQQIDQMAPNLKAVDRLEGVEVRLKQTEDQFEKARKAAKRAKDKFTAVKQKRLHLFMDAYNHISEKIDQVYKDLTKSTYHPLGGTAYLSLEDNEEPYLEGVRYHAMPPMKRFRDMEQLSGGEKTMAALALLFAIHSYHPSPFFVLDEVDAALDNANVAKIANYIRENASETFQFIVISLKSMLYQKAESLVGIYRDQDINSSRVLTLALDQYQDTYIKYERFMSSLLSNQKLSKEEYRKQKELDEARKAGTAPAEVDEEGNEINPHTPQFMLKAPWYVDTGKPGLKHQQAPAKKLGRKFDELGWYARGQRAGPAATKYRKGACENCGALTHPTRDCVERPRKKGAKWTGKNIQADEIVQDVDLDWDEKRDRWNGYDPKEHDRVVEEYERVEEQRRKMKAAELDKQGLISSEEAKKIVEGGNSGFSDDEYGDDEEKYADQADMPGQHVNTKTRTTIRNLRIREDTAKYLINLDTNSAYYDPKTRSMRENPLQEGDPNDTNFAGDNFTRYSGDAPNMAKAQMFAWQAADRGNEVHLQANPTQLALLHKQFEEQKEKVRDTNKGSILAKYGGEEHLQRPPTELLLAQSENYVEYSRTGKVVKGQERAVARSKYEEDVYTNNHTSVWGSYWADGRWGYKCCHAFLKNSYCTGSAGIEAAEVASAKALLAAGK